MGYMRHHAIVVTSFGENAEKAHAEAKRIFAIDSDKYFQACCPVTELSDEVTNGYRSFAILPDGSKEGWDTSNEGDIRRAQFIAWLETQEYGDGSSPHSWAELQYGDDEHDSKITRHSDEPNGSECRPYKEE